MAIKVKHDGNVTSRIYASAAGGKGKRQADDAIRLAQLQASAAGRSGGTGGGAHASATAPTTHAPTSHAQLGSTGSFISPQMSPETRMRLADNELTNKLIEMDNADAYRAAAQERQGEIDLSNSLERMNRGAEIDAERELTAQGRRERAALVDEVVRAVRDGKYGKDEIPGLIESYREAEDRIKLADSLRDREPTEQERFDKSIVTDADGNRFYKNAKGDYVPLPNPTAEAQATEAKRQAEEQKKLEAERQKAEQKRAEERQKYIDKAVEKAENDAVNELSIDDLKDVQKKAGERYDELHPIQPATPPTQFTIDEARKLLDPFAQYGGYESLMKTPAPASAAKPPPAVAKTVEDAKKKWGVKR